MMVGRGRPKIDKGQLPGVVEAFLDRVRERGLAETTREAYERDLVDVCGFLKKEGKNIETASTDDLKAYLSEFGIRKHKKRNGIFKETSGGSIRRRLSALSQFYEFLVSEGKRIDDPTSTIERPKHTWSLSGSV